MFLYPRFEAEKFQSTTEPDFLDAAHARTLHYDSRLTIAKLHVALRLSHQYQRSRPLFACLYGYTAPAPCGIMNVHPVTDSGRHRAERNS